MTDPNYIKHFRNIGKFAFIWDYCNEWPTNQNLYLARLADQIATGEPEDNALVSMIGLQFPGWLAAINIGPTTLQARIRQAFNAYLLNPAFQADIETELTASGKADLVLIDFQNELIADTKTLSVKGTTGIVNFLEAMYAPIDPWPTDADPDYPDGTYVTATVLDS